MNKVVVVVVVVVGRMWFISVNKHPLVLSALQILPAYTHTLKTEIMNSTV